MEIDVAWPISSIGLLVEYVVNLRMTNRFARVVGNEVLLGNVCDVFGLGVFRKQVIERLVAARTHVFWNGLPPFLRVAERRIHIEDHPAKGIDPVADHLSDAELGRTHFSSNSAWLYKAPLSDYGVLYADPPISRRQYRPSRRPCLGALKVTPILPCQVNDDCDSALRPVDGFRLEPVFISEFRILGCHTLGKIKDHFRLFPRGVILHFPVDHYRTGAVGHRIDDFTGK